MINLPMVLPILIRLSSFLMKTLLKVFWPQDTLPLIHIKLMNHCLLNLLLPKLLALTKNKTEQLTWCTNLLTHLSTKKLLNLLVFHPVINFLSSLEDFTVLEAFLLLSWFFETLFDQGFALVHIDEKLLLSNSK